MEGFASDSEFAAAWEQWLVVVPHTAHEKLETVEGPGTGVT